MAQERQVENAEQEEHVPTEEDLANLSEEERAALKDGEQADKGGEGDEGETEDAETAGKGEGEDRQETDEASAPERAAFIPTYTFSVEELQQKETEAAQKIANLTKQFEAGDITIAQYLEQRDEIRDELQSLRIKSELRTELTEENIRNAWEQEQEQFFAEHPEWTLEKNPALYGALNEQVKALAADPAHANWSGSRILNEAMKEVAKYIRPPSEDGGAKERAEGAAATKEGDEKGAGKEGKEKMPKPKPPQTLAHVPAAKETETGQGEFDGLDRLEGLELEKAIARMSPEQQERYAAGL